MGRCALLVPSSSGLSSSPLSFPAPPCASRSLQSQPGRWNGARRTGHASLPSPVSPSASLCDQGLVHPLMIHCTQPGAAWPLPKAESPPAEKGRLSLGAGAAVAKLSAWSPGQHELVAWGHCWICAPGPGHAETVPRVPVPSGHTPPRRPPPQFPCGTILQVITCSLRKECGGTLRRKLQSSCAANSLLCPSIPLWPQSSYL